MFYCSRENSKKVNNKFVAYNIYLLAHKGSGFDSFIVLNNSPQRRSVINLNKNGAGIVSLKIFNGYVHEKKKNTAVHSCSFQMRFTAYQRFFEKDGKK